MAEAVHDAERLAELQALPLDRKIQISQARIIEWYNHYHGNVVVSFSGGKDSTVLLHMVRKIYPHVKAVFSNTGLEYPEIQRFVKAQDNVDIVTPTMRFNEVISTYGYPLISKEVAEAIYYARRICSQTVNVEREARSRDPAETPRTSWATILRKRGELLGNRPNGRNWNWGERRTTSSRREQRETDGRFSWAGCHPQTDGTQGGGYSGSRRNGEEKERPRREAPENAESQKSRDSQWQDWRRGCL